MNSIIHIQQKKSLQLTTFQTAQQSQNTMSNTEAWLSSFPVGMKFHDGERGSDATIGSNPHIHMIPVSGNIEEVLKQSNCDNQVYLQGEIYLCQIHWWQP